MFMNKMTEYLLITSYKLHHYYLFKYPEYGSIAFGEVVTYTTTDQLSKNTMTLAGHFIQTDSM